MATFWEGGEKEKPQYKLEGKKVIVERIGCYDGKVNMCYTRETIYYFDTEELALEFYYKTK